MRLPITDQQQLGPILHRFGDTEIRWFIERFHSDVIIWRESVRRHIADCKQTCLHFAIVAVFCELIWYLRVLKVQKLYFA